MAVFCGSHTGSEPAFINAARALGNEMSRQGIELIYGGGRIGLMGVVADAVLESGGQVTGVIPAFLQAKEIAHDRLTRMITVESMHERKRIMQEMSDGFIALPGGFGTLEELFEVITWAQLGLHRKPIALFNVAGFFDTLLQFVHTMVNKGMLTPAGHDLLLMSDEVSKLIQLMRTYQPADLPTWINANET